MNKFLSVSQKALVLLGSASLAPIFSIPLLGEAALAQRIERGVGCRNTANTATGSFTLNILDPGYTFLSVKADGSFYPDGKGGPLIVAYVPLYSTNATGRRIVTSPQKSFALSLEGRTLRVVVTPRGPRTDVQTGSFVRGVVCNPSIRGDEVAQPPSAPTNPPPSTCQPVLANGYYCPPIAFASPRKLVASSTAYPEPQPVEANVVEPNIALGEWKGSSWNLSNDNS
jgi:hypothetical protein